MIPSFVRAQTTNQSKTEKDVRHYAMIHAGDIEHGAKLFASDSLACWTCHALDGSRDKPGPDLVGIGDKMGHGDILDAILKPSATITDGFNTTVVEMKNGEEYTGILSEANDSWIELKRPRLDPIRLPLSDIVTHNTSELSLMPEGLHHGISPQDLSDLVEYLGTLKHPDNATRFHSGTPVHISTIAKPIGFLPFHEPDLAFDRPAWMGQIPGEPQQYLIIEHAKGRIWLLKKRIGDDQKSLFLDLGSDLNNRGARGLMGLAFHPRFRSNGRYFFALHVNENGQHIAMTVERKATDDLRHDSGQASKVILRWNATTSSHTDGGLTFGPDHLRRDGRHRTTRGSQRTRSKHASPQRQNAAHRRGSPGKRSAICHPRR